MWLRDPQDIEVSRNAVVPLGFQLLDEATNEYIDLSGAIITCNVASTDGSTDAVVAFNATNISPTTGEFDIVFDGGQFSAFATSQQSIILSYEIKVAQSGESVIAMRGNLYLNPGIN